MWISRKRIPIFTAQLEKSRDAVTIANLRSAYAEAQTAVLTETSDTNNGVTFKKETTDGSYTVTVSGVVAKGTQDGLDGIDELSWLPSANKSTLKGKASIGGTPGTYTITFTYTNDAISNVTATKATGSQS